MGLRKRKIRQRAYQPIWEHIKTHKVCKVKVRRNLVAKVKKAVIKEKYNDDGYRDRYNGKLVISIEDHGGPLEVTLIFRLDEVSKFI